MKMGFNYLFTALAFVLLLFVTIKTKAQPPNFVPTNGLVGYWPFNGNANDLSGNGNNGIVYGATLTNDRFSGNNNAYLFSGGNNGRIVLPLATTISNNFTIVVWVQPNRSILMQYESGVCPIGVSVPLAYSNQNWLVNPSQANNPNVAAGGLSVGTNGIMSAEHGINILVARHLFFTDSLISGFECIALVYRSDSTFLYVNGVPVVSKAIHCPTANKILGDSLYLGGSLWSPAFSGVVDDIGVWNRALTRMEITSVFAGNNSNVGINTTNPQRNLHVNNTMRLEPRFTAPDNPVEGDLYYDGNLHKLRVYDGTQWQNCW